MEMTFRVKKARDHASAFSKTTKSLLATTGKAPSPGVLVTSGEDNRYLTLSRFNKGRAATGLNTRVIHTVLTLIPGNVCSNFMKSLLLSGSHERISSSP